MVEKNIELERDLLHRILAGWDLQEGRQGGTWLAMDRLGSLSSYPDSRPTHCLIAGTRIGHRLVYNMVTESWLISLSVCHRYAICRSEWQT